MKDIIDQLIVFLIAAALWILLWWHIISKIGFSGRLRKLWVFGMCLPPVNVAVMLLLWLLPWPIHRELRVLRRQLKDPGQEVEAELRKLRSHVKNSKSF